MRQQLDYFNCPQDLIALDKLPKMTTGMIRKNELLARYITCYEDIFTNI